MAKILTPNSCIGIVGGGQLGRMLSIAAAHMGFRVHIFSPVQDCPAIQVSQYHTVASYDDKEALLAFAKKVDVVTFEFENIPVKTLKILETHTQVFPSYTALDITQDRYVEKKFLESIGIPVAPFSNIETIHDLEQACETISASILKTRRFGYDGKGQHRVHSYIQACAAWKNLDETPAVLENIIPFVAEFSVIAVRDQRGNILHYTPSKNVHKNHILHTSTVPSGLSKSMLEKAVKQTYHILDKLGYVGVMGVEFFALADNTCLVNELAPRVHNSGHWTMRACLVDQFENHIRAVAGWPLGGTHNYCNAVMQNLIGSDVNTYPQWAAKNAAVYIYGKKDVLKDRKMGHIIYTPVAE